MTSPSDAPSDLSKNEKQEQSGNLQDIFAHDANIAPITNIYIEELFALYDYNKNYSGKFRDRNNHLLAQCANIFLAPQGFKVLGFIREKGFTTQEEIQTETGIGRGTISRNLKKLQNLHLVSIDAYVESPFKVPGTRGAQVAIYGYYGADPSLAHRAQKRWAEIDRSQAKDKLEARTNTVYHMIENEVIDYLVNTKNLDPRDIEPDYILRVIKELYPDNPGLNYKKRSINIYHRLQKLEVPD